MIDLWLCVAWDTELNGCDPLRCLLEGCALRFRIHELTKRIVTLSHGGPGIFNSAGAFIKTWKRKDWIRVHRGPSR